MRARRRFFLCLLLPLLVAGPAALATPAWDRAAVAPMKTSIYIGTVTLTLQPLARHDHTLTATYSAKVFPWAFWSETGDFRLAVTDAELARLARGERCAFTGEAHNQKGRKRTVTGYADPTGPDQGNIKVRIGADGITLVFNGRYTLSAAPRAHAQASPAQ